MAEEDERKPLLLSEDGIKTEFLPPREKVKSLFESDEELEVPEAFRNGNKSGIFINEPTRLPRHTEADVVTCIFVVAFDTRSGNMIEWCIPRDIDLDGIEFKAMPSGSHNLTNDFVYFRKDDLFGLACFENMRVQSELERGARMKSVGIMATSYTLLYRHMQFLETQVRHQLETPGNYEKMMAFYEDKKGILPPSHSVDNLRHLNAGSPGSELLPELRITHPAGCFSQFLNFFGVHIFTLWKFALLKKRILFFSPPPIGVVCYRVYCACCLAMHHMPGINTTDLKPYFYVNVADINTLESELSYVACTTESIFQHKTGLYDVYVDNQNVTANSPVLKDIINVSSADKDKFTKLNNQRSLNLYRKLESGDGGADEDDEEMFISYFTELNNRLFQTLLDVSMSQDKQLTSEHMESMGLDATGDRAFLMELVETYAIDVMLMVDNSCCPRGMM